MQKEYQKHIATTDTHQVWLHRTDNSNIENILKKGLNFGSGNLASTATLQPKKLDEAENVYKSGKDYGNTAIVIKIPKEIANKYYHSTKEIKGRRHEGYESDKDVTYYDKGFHIQRQHIHGWIDRKTNEYHPNLYLDEPQQLTDKHFPESFYGGLEKDLIEPEKHPKEIKSSKIKQSKTEKLPSPPSEINILP